MVIISNKDAFLNCLRHTEWRGILFR